MGKIKSPQVTYSQVVTLTEAGPVISFDIHVPPELPTEDAFALRTLIRSGVSPDHMHIHTASSSRQDSLNEFNKYVEEAENLLNQRNDQLSETQD